MLLATPRTLRAQHHGPENKGKTQERPSGRVVVTAEHGESSAQRGDSGEGDGDEDALHDRSLSVRCRSVLWSEAGCKPVIPLPASMVDPPVTGPAFPIPGDRLARYRLQSIRETSPTNRCRSSGVPRSVAVITQTT